MHRGMMCDSQWECVESWQREWILLFLGPWGRQWRCLIANTEAQEWNCYSRIYILGKHWILSSWIGMHLCPWKVHSCVILAHPVGHPVPLLYATPGLCFWLDTHSLPSTHCLREGEVNRTLSWNIRFSYSYRFLVPVPRVETLQSEGFRVLFLLFTVCLASSKVVVGSSHSVPRFFLCQVGNTWSVHFLDHLKHKRDKGSGHTLCGDCTGPQKLLSLGHLMTSLQDMFPLLFWGPFSQLSSHFKQFFFPYAQQASWIKQHLIPCFVFELSRPYVPANQTAWLAEANRLIF